MRGWRIFAEGTGTAGSLPEDLGQKVAYELLDELSKSAVLGRNQLKLALAYMVIGKEDVGRLKIHKSQVDEQFIWFLRDLKSIFGLEAYLKDGAEEGENDYMTVAIKGNGFTSASKKRA